MCYDAHQGRVYSWSLRACRHSSIWLGTAFNGPQVLLSVTTKCGADEMPKIVTQTYTPKKIATLLTKGARALGVIVKFDALATTGWLWPSGTHGVLEWWYLLDDELLDEHRLWRPSADCGRDLMINCRV
eukprot:4564163-Amphidinium_carterae.1